MSENETDKKKGLLVVYTGNGKGKTTAALGMCVRAVGYDWRICLIQFVKGSWKYGELKGVKRLEPNLELYTVGEGFVGIVDDQKEFSEHREAARKGVALAIEKIKSGDYQLVILDELNVAMDLGLVTDEELEQILDARSPEQHLVITGRGMTDELKERADLITEMGEIKHPYQKGILAQKGIDW
ncbi:MAG TPA: cob(I)yrinic acid a,c-diamide adenosyltransferase [candidate division Zixibacteria bacterium]|nr:cob(I)yrinic acid a,c-diamide adenosyltransferase [candidate division Zixibacteria bacterium]